MKMHPMRGAQAGKSPDLGWENIPHRIVDLHGRLQGPMG